MLLINAVNDAKEFFAQYDPDISESEIVETVTNLQSVIIDNEFDELQLAEYIWQNRDSKVITYLLTKLSIIAISTMSAALIHELDNAIDINTSTEQ
jgi:hypothetical protein